MGQTPKSKPKEIELLFSHKNKQFEIKSNRIKNYRVMPINFHAQKWHLAYFRPKRLHKDGVECNIIFTFSKVYQGRIDAFLNFESIIKQLQ